MISQFSGLYLREILRTFRNPFVLIITIVQPFMWLAFFGSSFANAPPAFLQSFIGSNSYIAFLLPGTLSTSMLSVGMFGSMSTIQDKRFGFMKRILITPTSKGVIFLSKALGGATRGLVQFPIMMIAATVFGVRFDLSPLEWAAWIVALFSLAVGFASLFLAITASSTDWQTPGVVSNFITMPLMFASTALFSGAFFPSWMLAISAVNPITFSALLGRAFVLGRSVPWINLGYLGAFALGMLVVGYLVSSRWLRVD
ncbi:MAG TPA: ABC transporter permease [Thermoplasmata archaeon]|jgi:ABC-2 type transport system permease protein|nr:ABC transporter permease [Thermoplasmata archaeon]